MNGPDTTLLKKRGVMDSLTIVVILIPHLHYGHLVARIVRGAAYTEVND